MQSTCRGLVSNISEDVERTELRELLRQMSLAANISNACRRHMTSLYAAVLDSNVDEDRRTLPERRRPCRLDDYLARVAAYSASYWARVDEAVRPAMIAHRRYVDRVGSAPPAVDRDAGSGTHRAAAWFDFPRALFNVSRRRFPWTRRQRRRRQRQRGPSAVNDDYDDTVVDFLMFLDVPDVDDAMMWKTRLRQRCMRITKYTN